MLVTLLTFHAPMSWSKTDAPSNMYLYSEKQHTDYRREKEGHSVR
jgi:hypothetical protein